MFDYMGISKLFGNIGDNFPIIIFLSPDFAKCRPYVIHIRIKWLTEPFYMDAFTDEIYRILIQTTRKAPTLFNLFHCLSR